MKQLFTTSKDDSGAWSRRKLHLPYLIAWETKFKKVQMCLSLTFFLFFFCLVRYPEKYTKISKIYLETKKLLFYAKKLLINH